MTGAEEEIALQRLVAMGEEVIASDLRIVVKWQGELVNKHAVESAQHTANQLVQFMGLPTIQEDASGEHITFRSSAVMGNVSVKMNWQIMDQTHSYVIVTLEGSRGLHDEQLIELQGKYAQALERVGVTPVWNASVQGSVNKQESVQEAMNEFEQNLQGYGTAAVVESYTDQTTVSHTYQIPDWTIHAMSGDIAVHMQAAVHLNEQTGTNRITIGLPLITIEY